MYSSHHAFIWGNCDLAADLEQGQVKGWLLGDSAHCLSIAAVATDHYFKFCGKTTTAIQQCPLQNTREDRTHVWNIEEPLPLSSQVGGGAV